MRVVMAQKSDTRFASVGDLGESPSIFKTYIAAWVSVEKHMCHFPRVNIESTPFVPKLLPCILPLYTMVLVQTMNMKTII